MAGVLLRPKWAGARRDKGAYPQRSVTEEQRSPRPFSAQPFGPQFFWPPASLLVPYRPGRVCSSLAPSGRPKSLAAKHQLFVRHITSCFDLGYGVAGGAAGRFPLSAFPPPLFPARFGRMTSAIIVAAGRGT